jgi:hypothetical protein
MGLPDDLAARLTIAEQHDLLHPRRNGPRRGGVRRRGVLAGTAGAVAALAAGAPAAATLWRQADALPGKLVVPFGRHLAWGANPRAQVRVGWQVPHPVRKPYVRVGDSPVTLGHRIPAEVRDLHSALPGAETIAQYYVHAALDHLHAGRRYYYAVGHDGYEPPFSRVESFTTAPTRRTVAEPFTFTAFGDQGVSYHALTNDGLVAAQRPAFHLHAGDLCYADSSGHGNDSDLFQPRTWDQFLAQSEPVAASVPWMATMGNHDMEAFYSPDGYGGQRARWDFPDNGPAKATGAYSFLYGNVGVVALDSNDVSYEIPANRGYTGGTQTAWLDQRLKHLRAQPDVDFVVVFHHHCAYSTTVNHASEGGVRSQWVPLFDKHHVDLVINGHNHVYERADTMRGGKGRPAPAGATVHPETDGTTYITAGAGGRSLYGFAVPDSYAGHVRNVDQVRSHVAAAGRHKVVELVGWSRVRYTGYSFLAVDAAPAAASGTATLTLRALAESGNEIDRLVLARKTDGVGRAHLDDAAA